MVAKKLGTSVFRLFASPTYLKKAGMPQRPQDLQKHACLRFTGAIGDRVWDLRKGERKARIQVKARVAANNIASIKDLAVAGYGIALLPLFVCADETKRRHLVPTLPDWTSEPEPIHALYSSQRYVPPKTRALIEFLAKTLKFTH